MTKRETWELASDDDLPERLHPQRHDLRIICSNGLDVPFNIGALFLHRPSSWPQCFHGGGEATCTVEIVKRAVDGELMPETGERRPGVDSPGSASGRSGTS